MHVHLYLRFGITLQLGIVRVFCDEGYRIDWDVYLEEVMTRNLTFFFNQPTVTTSDYNYSVQCSPLMICLHTKWFSRSKPTFLSQILTAT